MKVRMTVEMPAGTRVPEELTRIDSNGKRVVPVGTEFEGGDVHLMLVHGCAEPVDDEAIQFCKELDRKQPNARGVLLQAHASITEEFNDFAEELAQQEDDDE